MEIFRSVDLVSGIREAGKSIAPSSGIYAGESLKSVVESKPRKPDRKAFPLLGLFQAGPEKGQFITQEMAEPVLLEAAKERGVDTRFHTECVSIDQDDEKVIAVLRNRSTDRTYTVTADYLIAADGANSPIREQLNIQRSGKGSLGNLLNILFHTTPSLESLVKDREFSLIQVDRPEVSGLFTSINNSDRWVFHLLYSPTRGEKPEDFTYPVCEKLLHKALGIGEDEVKIDIKSILPWQASVRVAEKTQVGRIFLAGDSAHQMPPYAGQGANSGIADVQNLVWKLALVLQNHASPSLLETYEVERLPVGRMAAELSGKAADDRGMIHFKKDWKTVKALAGRAHILSGYGYTYSSKAIVQESTWPLGGVTWRPWSVASLTLGLDGRPGSRTPHVDLEKKGKPISSLDLLGKDFVILAGSDGEKWVEAAKLAVSEMEGFPLVAYAVGGVGEIQDPKKMWETAAGISSTGALLVRPDGFVAWRQRRAVADVNEKLKQMLQGLVR